MQDASLRDSLMIQLARRAHLLARVMGVFAPSPAVSRVERDVVYGRDGDEGLALDVFIPTGGGPWPVVVMIHGGGFVAGDKTMLGHTCGVLASAGFLTFNVNYRLAPEAPYPACVDDCVLALQWVYEHAGDYGGDPSRLCVGGGSAGGYLAAQLGVLSRCDANARHSGDSSGVDRAAVPAIDAVLLLNGVFDVETLEESEFPNAAALIRAFFGDRHADPGIRHTASPIHHLTAGFPPTFVGVGTIDTLRAESIAISEALSALGVAVESREYPGSGHGWFNWYWTPNARRAHADMVAWLRGRLV